MRKIGLDIGTTGVRLVETSLSARSVTVRRAVALPLPVGVIVDGLIKDPQTLAGILKTLVRQAKLTSRAVHVSVGSHPHLIVRDTRVPYIAGGKHTDELVRSAASDAMPVDVDSLCLAHHVYNVYSELTPEGRKVEKANAILVAMDAKHIEALTSVLESAGLRPAAIDATPLTLTRMVAGVGSGPGRVDVVVHVGAHTLSLIAVVDGQFRGQRPIPEYAGERLTEAVAEIARVRREDAEHMKITTATASAIVAAATATDVSQYLAAWTDTVISELNLAIRGLSTGTGFPVGRVWLSGGGGRLAGLAPRLGAVVDQHVQVGLLDPSTWVTNPDKLTAKDRTGGQDMTLALALAMR